MFNDYMKKVDVIFLMTDGVKIVITKGIKNLFKY
jgi:hypothetical protein